LVSSAFLPLKIVSKRKKQKKRKPFNQGGQAEKPKGNGISPEGWQGNLICPAIMP
jgi:hypothetical protein